MKNIINNNCSNNTNNEINNNKSEVKTMRKITNNTINFNANALNSSIIASARYNNSVSTTKFPKRLR